MRKLLLSTLYLSLVFCLFAPVSQAKTYAELPEPKWTYQLPRETETTLSGNIFKTNNTLYISTAKYVPRFNEQLVALDDATGKAKFTFDMPYYIHQNHIVTGSKGQFFVNSYTTKKLFGVNAAGKKMWEKTLASEEDQIFPFANNTFLHLKKPTGGMGNFKSTVTVYNEAGKPLQTKQLDGYLSLVQDDYIITVNFNRKDSTVNNYVYNSTFQKLFTYKMPQDNLNILGKGNFFYMEGNKLQIIGSKGQNTKTIKLEDPNYNNFLTLQNRIALLANHKLYLYSPTGQVAKLTFNKSDGDVNISVAGNHLFVKQKKILTVLDGASLKLIHKIKLSDQNQQQHSDYYYSSDGVLYGYTKNASIYNDLISSVTKYALQ